MLKANFKYAADDWAWSVFSDVYKSDTGIRPICGDYWTPERAEAYLARREAEYQANRKAVGAFPKGCLIRYAECITLRVTGHSDPLDGPAYIYAKTLSGRERHEIDPKLCKRVQ